MGGKHDFAKPGIDHFQQGFVFANGEPTPVNEQPGGGSRLPYSPVGIELRPGKLRVKEDSRANYADIVDIDHDAQVMVVGDVVRYFDRVRRNVNKAFMRQILRRALEEYKAGRAYTSGNRPEDSDISKMPQSATEEGDDAQLSATESMQQVETASVLGEKRYDKEEKRPRRHSGSSARSTRSRKHRTESQASARPSREDPRQALRENPREAVRENRDHDFDLRSMHNVAMAGLK